MIAIVLSICDIGLDVVSEKADTLKISHINVSVS